MPLDLTLERTFTDCEHPTRYLHIPGEKQELVVIFSGFEPVGQPRYSYVRTLEDSAIHRVYILDDLGPRGCYYFGQERDLLAERSVVAVVEHVREKLGIGRADVTLAGSSKGGTAALYLAVRHGYGKVLAGAPQSLVGTYLTDESRSMAVVRLIAGDDSDESVQWLDTLVLDAIRQSPYRPVIELFTSDGDAQRPLHVTPLVELLESLRYDVSVIEGTYRPHKNVVGQYKELLHERFV